MDYFNSLPQVAELVTEAVSFLTNASISDSDLLRALQRLQARQPPPLCTAAAAPWSLSPSLFSSITEARAAIASCFQDLVEPIDVANDLHTLGGLVPTLRHLGHVNASIRAAAAHVIGESRSRLQAAHLEGVSSCEMSLSRRP